MMRETPLEKEVIAQLDGLIETNIVDALAEDVNYANWIDFNDEWSDKEVEEAISDYNNKCLDYIILKLIKIRKSDWEL